MTERSQEETIEQMKQVDVACESVKKHLAPLDAEVCFNVILNLFVEMIAATPNPLITLGGAMLAISQALLMKQVAVEYKDIEDLPSGNRTKSTH